MFRGTLIDYLGRVIMLSSVEYMQSIYSINSCSIEAHMISGNRLVILMSTDKDVVDYVWNEFLKWTPDTSTHHYFNVNDAVLDYRVSHEE